MVERFQIRAVEELGAFWEQLEQPLKNKPSATVLRKLLITSASMTITLRRSLLSAASPFLTRSAAPPTAKTSGSERISSLLLFLPWDL
ncbi:hypothetical protein DEO72_LG10g3253 [Vigna unguiculata]|uniref:Uncharacterized protein n=1 Tax=Vigna unguiculata TaxID=3917 RepID=A0A4D6NH55_VIGUN|nr:hypothetical protein DEO72_LG10g3253 [Vigna unguiculata]